MTSRTGALLVVSCFVGIAAMVYAGRPISFNRLIQPAMALWAAVPYVVAYLVLKDASASGGVTVAGILALSIGPALIFNAQTWFGIDTRYNAIFMVTPLLQVACFLPFGLVARRGSRLGPATPRRPTGR
jgi:hypothetical protein